MKTHSHTMIFTFLLAGFLSLQMVSGVQAQKIYRDVTNDYVASGVLAYPRENLVSRIKLSAFPGSTTTYSYSTFNIASTSITTTAGAAFNVVTAGTTQTISLPAANVYPLRHVTLRVVWTVLSSGTPALATSIGLVQDKGGGVTYSASPVGVGSITGNTFYFNAVANVPEDITFDDDNVQNPTQLANQINLNVAATGSYTLGYTGTGQSVGGVLGNFTNAVSGGVNDSAGTWTFSFQNGDVVNYKLSSFTITGTSDISTPSIALAGGGTVTVNVSTRATYQGKSLQTEDATHVGGTLISPTSRKDSQQ